MNRRVERWGWPAGGVLARAALAAGFLSAVADRFGLWGARGTGDVGWGDASVFGAASAALLLALVPDRAFALSAVPAFQRDRSRGPSGTGAVPEEVGRA
jgi:hypothetical protein